MSSKTLFWINGSLTSFCIAYSLKKFKSRVCGTVGVYEMSQKSSLEIDDLFDIYLAKQFLKSGELIL